MPAELKWKRVDSSNVEQIAFDEHTNTLAVRFYAGGLYTYDGVSMEVFTSMEHADSVGKFLNRVIKPTYQYNKWTSDDEMLNYIARK